MPKKSNAILSCSVDGTVRAFDLVKYKNFRTFKPNESTQLTCLAIEANGDIVCAGSREPFNVYIWSIKTSQLIDILSGHTAPISSLSFSPTSGILATSSWDKTVRTWDIFGKNGLVDTFTHPSEVIQASIHPNSNDVIATTLGGQVYVWDSEQSSVKGVIDCHSDIKGGRLRDDRNTANNSTKNKYFNSICLSPSG